MSHPYPDANELRAMRGMLLRSVATLTIPAMNENSLAARNVLYHSEELCRWLDAFYSGQDPAEPDE